MTASQTDVDALLSGELTGGRNAQDAPDASTSPNMKAPSGQQSALSRRPYDRSASVLAQRPGTPDIERILGLSVPVTVQLAERHLPVESILEMTTGTIIEFDVPFDSELTLQVANRTIGNGQAVKVGENFGLRVTAIETVSGRIDALRGR